jgi:cytochrome c biogenesis protein CcmG/thiol:disulfide interchange protein DsbE
MKTDKNLPARAVARRARPIAATLPTQPGEPAPEFEGRPLAGRAPIRLADYRGKVVYLDFWASWCQSCRHSLPWMERLHRGHQPAGLEVISVNIDETPADARAFLKRNPVGFPVIEDSQGTIAALYDVQDLPTSFLVDRDGVLLSIHRGFRTADAPRLDAAVAAALRKPLSQ